MKLTSQDLQIGDWVMYNPNVFIEDEYAPTQEQYPTQIKNGEDIDLAIEGCYTPISITPEILENNGFEYQEGWEEWWHECEDGFGSDFQLSITEDGFSIKDTINAQINYIHQLQQAMRLCKIRKEIEL